MLKTIIRTGIKVFLLYFLWLFLFKGLNLISPSYNAVMLGFYNAIRFNIIHITTWFVQMTTGLKVTSLYDTIYFAGHGAFIISIDCLAVKLLYVFAIFIIVIPGASWKPKLWYIPAGLIIIHLMNIIRMIVLSYTIIYTHYFEFMHSFVFRIIIYLTIIGLWYIWLKYFIDMEKLSNMMKADEPAKTADKKQPGNTLP